MNIPDTPRTTISRIKKGDLQGRQIWEQSWHGFFNIYVRFVEACVSSYFGKCNWKPSSSQIEDTVAAVFLIMLKLAPLYDAQKGRFHQYLRGIVRIVVMRMIKEFKRDSKNVSFDETFADIELMAASKNPEAFRSFATRENIFEQLSVPADQESRLKAAERDEAVKALYAELLSIAKTKASPRMAMVFQMRVIDNMPADEVAAELNISRGVVDNDKYKFMKVLQELASTEPYKSELKELLSYE